jgi:hypothetical protein
MKNSRSFIGWTYKKPEPEWDRFGELFMPIIWKKYIWTKYMPKQKMRKVKITIEEMKEDR